MRIVEPRWTRPAWTRPGQGLDVVLEDAGPGDLAAVLTTRDRAHDLRVESRGLSADGKFTRIMCRVGDAAPDGLGGLEIVSSSCRASAPNSVCVARDQAESFAFLHTSDLHLVAKRDAVLLDRRPIAEALVERINALSPAFVLNTGDIVSRYGVGGAKLSDELIWWQAREARRIFLKLDRPMFVVPGNHDLAFAASRSAWARHMGGPWDRATDDYAFRLGGCCFVGVDRSARCDENTHAKMPLERAPEQLAWLGKTLRAAGPGPRVVFTHFDYTGDLAEVMAAEGCDLLLCGHLGAGPKGDFPWRMGHLRGGQALARWRVTDGAFVSEGEVPYADLGRPSLLE